MKKYLLFILLLLPFSKIKAQNLVINPGVENYITCPGFGQWSNTYISNWSKPSYGSTDYYNYNCPLIVPTQQTPHSGNAYFGIIAYNYGTEYREYATAELAAPLIAGGQYKVEFYVSLNDGYIQAISEVGAYLSATAPGPFPNALHIAVTPQIQNTTGILGDTAAWMLVSGSFIAAGGEQFITIGNFNDDSSTTITQVGNSGSYGTYYFVDDVSVTPSLEGIDETAKQLLTVYPNPSNGTFKLTFTTNSYINYQCTVSDCFGRTILNPDIDEAETSIDLSEFNNGIYFLRLSSKSETICYKLIKM